jgi:Protein of unknown function (DUF3768)
MTSEDPARTAKIRELNDALRCEQRGGEILLTPGVNELGLEALAQVLAAVASFDAFTEGDDPYGEHDFGAFDLDGTRFFWKIDYYDLKMEQGSDDPSDPEKTRRVLTIMRADEY